MWDLLSVYTLRGLSVLRFSWFSCRVGPVAKGIVHNVAALGISGTFEERASASSRLVGLAHFTPWALHLLTSGLFFIWRSPKLGLVTGPAGVLTIPRGDFITHYSVGWWARAIQYAGSKGVAAISMVHKAQALVQPITEAEA